MTTITSEQKYISVWKYGPLTRYVKLRVAHVPGMPGTLSPSLRVNDPDIHQGTCVTHVPWCMPGSLTSGFLWSRWRGKRSRHSRRMRNPQFYVSGKRAMMRNVNAYKCLSLFPAKNSARKGLKYPKIRFDVFHIYKPKYKLTRVIIIIKLYE